MTRRVLNRRCRRPRGRNDSVSVGAFAFSRTAGGIPRNKCRGRKRDAAAAETGHRDMRPTRHQTVDIHHQPSVLHRFIYE